MRVGVLGPLVVHLGDGDVSVPGQRQRDLLTTLVLRRGTPVPADVLLDLVWRNENELTPAVVHTAVARLRRLCGAATVHRREAGYLVDRSTATDADSFVDLVQGARRTARRGEPAAAIELYRTALTRWRDRRAFVGVSGHLVDPERTRLSELRVTTHLELAELLLANGAAGDVDEAAALAEAAIREEPLRERGHQVAMLAAYRGGRQAAALEVYREIRRTLREELGVQPGSAISDLHGRILRQDPALSPRESTAPGSAVGPATAVRPGGGHRRREPRRPPAPLTPIVGRESVMSGLVDAVDKGRRLITLVGPGGVGKTRLLLELGAHYRDRRPIEYGELGAVTAADVDELAETVALSLGLEVSRRGAARSLVAALADDDWLLLVDEAEVVADALGPLAMQVLEGCPRVQIVVSSRRPLDVPGEQVWPVDPLDCASPGGGDPRDAAAVRLLVRRLADRSVPVDDDGETTRLLVDVVSRVDGLPLAVELVAGQASGRSLAELVDLVGTPLDVSVEGSRRLRQRSLRRTFASSLERLDPLQQKVFRRLSVFAGSFDRQSAMAVLTFDGEDGAAVGAAVPALVRDALVQVDRRDPGRLNFRLLTVLRALALDGLPPSERHQLRARHRDWFAARWRQERGRDELFQDVRDHQEDYLQALTSALADADGEAATALALTLAEYWQLSGARLAGSKWLGAALDSDALSPTGRARLQAQRAALLQNHDPDLVMADTLSAITVLDPTQDNDSVVMAFAVRALEQWIGGDAPAAVADADRGVRIAAQCGGQFLAQALSTQALVHAVTGDRPTALAAARRAAELLPAMPWASRRLSAALNLSLALVNLGRFDDAVGVLDELAADLRQVVGPDAPSPPRFSINLGWAALGAGDLAGAGENFAHSLRRGGPVNPERESAEVVLGIGCVLSALSDPAAAAVLARARELMRRLAVPMSAELQAAVDRAEHATGGTGTAEWASESDGILVLRLRDLVDDALHRLGSGNS